MRFVGVVFAIVCVVSRFECSLDFVFAIVCMVSLCRTMCVLSIRLPFACNIYGVVVNGMCGLRALLVEGVVLPRLGILVLRVRQPCVCNCFYYIALEGCVRVDGPLVVQWQVCVWCRV